MNSVPSVSAIAAVNQGGGATWRQQAGSVRHACWCIQQAPRGITERVGAARATCTQTAASTRNAAAAVTRVWDGVRTDENSAADLPLLAALLSSVTKPKPRERPVSRSGRGAACARTHVAGETRSQIAGRTQLGEAALGGLPKQPRRGQEQRPQRHSAWTLAQS